MTDSLKALLAFNTFLALSLPAFLPALRGRALCHRHRLRIGQALVLASLALAVAVPLLPRPRGGPGPFPAALEVWDLDGAGGGARRRQTSPAPAGSRRPSRSGTAARETRRSPWRLLTLVLVAGVLFILVRLLSQIVRLRRCLRSAISFRRRGRVELLVSDECAIPFAVRTPLRALVVLPVDLLGNRPDLLLALRHELQHHRQGDTLWVFVCECLRPLAFWNPAFSVWVRCLSELQELACDERLVARRCVRADQYGGCLLRVAARQQRVFWGAAGMSRGGSRSCSLLRRRIQMLASHSDRSSSPRLARLILFQVLWLTGLGVSGSQLFGRSVTGAGTSVLPPMNEAIQKGLERALTDGVTRARAQGAFAVVVGATSGKVLAAAHVTRHGDRTHIDTSESHFLSEAVNPLSVTKPLIVGAALDAGKIAPSEIVDCEKGIYRVEGTTYHDWAPFGRLSVGEVLGHSSNIGAIKIAETLGGPGVVHALEIFGIGPGGSVVGFPGAAPGWLPSPTSESSPALAARLSGGEGYGATPLELTLAYAALGNGGRLLAPVPASDPSAPRVLRQVLSKTASDEMRTLLAGVVEKGTGTRASSPLYTTAGKTGTGRRSVGGKQVMVASFAGFAPVSDPRVAVFVAVENPKDGEATGGRHAAPVFRAIAESSLGALGVAPDRK